MNEIGKGLEYVNSRSNTDYENPDDVIIGAAKLAEAIIGGENVDFEFDSHIMAIDLFRAGGVVRPLRSYAIRKASDIWLSRN